MLQRSSACTCGLGGRALLRWWAASANQRYLHPQSPTHTAPAAIQLTARYSSARQLTKHSARAAVRTTRPARDAVGESVEPVTAQSLEAAHELESREDEAASSTVAAIHKQLRGLEAIANAIRSDIAAQNAALRSHDAEASDEVVKRTKHRAATLRDSYAALLQTAFRAHDRYAAYLKPHTDSNMSPQLAALERVWTDMCAHSQPTTEAFTAVLKAYGREGRRRRLRELVERWQGDRDEFLRKHDSSVSAHSSTTEAVEDDASVEVREANERKRAVARSRRRRQAAQGLREDVSLFPAVRMDKVAYNTALSGYLFSLPLRRFTSQSPELSFPLSLLPRFEHDHVTLGILMDAHGAMGEVPQVLQLAEQFRALRRAARIARGGAREPQLVRQQHKLNSQYMYASLLRAFDTVRDVESAERVWSDIKAKDSAGRLEVNRVMYHNMLAVYASANQQEKVRAISVEMSRAGLPMDAHSVCTVLARLCTAGHAADAIMLHTRLAHGSMGPGAVQSRQTYVCLLHQLSMRAEVPFLTVAEVYRQGVECGMLDRAGKVRTRDEATAALAGTWLANLSGVPLPLVPVALHYHLSEMLAAYITIVRRGRKTSPKQLLIVLASGSKQEEEEAEQREVEMEARDGHTVGHKRSVASIDWDETEADGQAADDKDALGDADDGESSGHTSRQQLGATRTLIDPFATEEERSKLSQLEALKVRGSYYQRYVQQLLKQEWPSMRAFDSSKPAEQPSANTSSDPSSPAIESTTASHSQLHVRGNQLAFWLAWHAHVAARDDPLFPVPHTNGQSANFVSQITRRIRERSQLLEAEQLRWERAKGKVTPAEAEASGAKSLHARLLEYKTQERERLHVQARVFNTKQLPTAATAATPQLRRQRATAGDGAAMQSKAAKSVAADSTAARVRGAHTVTAADRRAQRTRAAAERRKKTLQGAIDGTQSMESSRATEKGTERKRKAVRTRRAPSETLSAETLSSMLSGETSSSPATQQVLESRQQRQQHQKRAEVRAARADD